MDKEELESLARALLSQGLVQLSVHFPGALDKLGMNPGNALEHALLLSEESIAQKPELPDGHSALARTLLCHHDERALADAKEIFEHALTLNPDHDPAEIGLATIALENNATDEALARVNKVIKRGNSQPQPLVLRALIYMAREEWEKAHKDMERAVKIAPKNGLFRLDAAKAAKKSGNKAQEEQHRAAAKDVLGDAEEQLSSLIN